MENSKEAKAVVSEITQVTFHDIWDAEAREVLKLKCLMIGPGSLIGKYYVAGSRFFEVAKRLKHLCREHSREAEFLIKQQLQEEEKLAKKQADELKTDYKKHELIEGMMSDGTAQRLGRRYNLRLDDR